MLLCDTEFLMMKAFFEKVKFVILLVAVCQLLNTYCSKKLHPDPSPQKIERPTEINKSKEFNAAKRVKVPDTYNSHAENKKLKEFRAAGTNKAINTRNTSSDEIIKTAQNYLGVPHCMGGTTMKCLDCSGLLVTVFAKHGIRLPHNSEEQARYGKIISGMNELIKGDLVFFIRSYETHHFITHSGIYVGNNKFIHTSSKNGVIITSLNDPWWKEKFIFGTRVLE